MKLAKPQWNLAGYLVPPILSSLMLIVFFPTYLFSFLTGIAIFAALVIGWVGLVQPLYVNESPTDCGAKETCKWLFSLFSLIFLLGVVSVFFIFLTSASQFSPERLAFGEVTRTWHITFPTGISLLMTQISMAFLSSKKRMNPPFFFQKNAASIEKMRISGQIFLRFSGFTVLAISLSVVVMSIANGLARWFGIEVPSGFQVQTLIGSTLIYLPFATKRWRKHQFLKGARSRIYRFLKLVIGLILAILLLTVLTVSFTNMFIPLQFLSYGLTTFQWELFILSWWIGITSLMASQIVELSRSRSLREILIVLMISGVLVYGICAEFLLYGGKDYFLAVIREGILALILTALPIGILILKILPFQEIIATSSSLQRKQLQNRDYLAHSLIQGTVVACVLYWVSGLAILFIFPLIGAIPWLMTLLLVDMGERLGSNPGRSTAS